MPMPIVTEAGGASEFLALGTDTKDSPVVLSTTEGIRLSDILNLRVGCWRPAVYIDARAAGAKREPAAGRFGHVRSLYWRFTRPSYRAHDNGRLP